MKISTLNLSSITLRKNQWSDSAWVSLKKVPVNVYLAKCMSYITRYGNLIKLLKNANVLVFLAFLT